MFSILVANYNNGDLFKDCWESILKQTYQDFEVVIVDDASTDQSINIIKEIVQNDPRVRIVVNDKNYGCGYTKRRCAEIAKGEICGFVDPDDAIVENALELMVQAHEQHLNAAVISSKYYLVDMQMNVIAEGLNGESIPKGHSYLTYGKGAITHFATFKRLLYNKTEGIKPDLKRAVDQDLYFKLEEVGDAVFIDKLLYYYRIQERSISASKNAFKAEYWHYFLKKQTFLRRKQNQSLAVNYVPQAFTKVEQDYYLKRMKHEASQKKWANKYYFLCLAFKGSFFTYFKHKCKCLLIYSYS
jgi:glycosyltransferase involved in cell wall biosynthesis